MRLKKDNIFWGIVFIFAAVFLLATNMGYFPAIGFWKIGCTIVIGGWFLSSVKNVEFTGMLFSLAFLCIVYDKELGLEAITPWPVLGAALFGSIGCSLIFEKRSRKKYKSNHSNDSAHYHSTDAEFDTIIDEPDSSVVDCKISFGATVKYVNSDCFESANIDCSFGAAKVYFDNAVLKGESADVYLDISFAGVELFIPKEWRVENQVKTTFDGIEEKGSCIADSDAKVITLHGKIEFAGLTIRYI